MRDHANEFYGELHFWQMCDKFNLHVRSIYRAKPVLGHGRNFHIDKRQECKEKQKY